MKQVYISRVVETEPATPLHYVYDERVEPGKVLVLKNLCATFAGLKTSEEVQFFVEDGGVKKFLGEDLAVVQGGYPHWRGSVPIGEGDRAGVYIPDSAASDVISFFVFGELWSVEAWRKINE